MRVAPPPPLLLLLLLPLRVILTLSVFDSFPPPIQPVFR